MTSLHPFIKEDLSKADIIENYEILRKELKVSHKQLTRLFEAVKLQKEYFSSKIEGYLKEIESLKHLIITMNNIQNMVKNNKVE